MQLTAKHHEYWRKNLVITAILLVIWFVATFVEGWYARELNSITFLGFPLGFYMSAQGSLIIYVVIIWHLRALHEQARQRIRRATKEKTNEPGCRLQPRAHSTSQLKKYYSFYTGGFIAFLIALAIAEQMGMSRQWIGYWFLFATIALYAGIGIMSRTVGCGGILRRRTARAGVLQRHGDRRRLDERGVVHRHGRHAVPLRLRRPRVRHGLDRRLLPGGAVPRAVSAQVRPVHDSRLSRRALRRQHRPQRSASSPRSCARSSTSWRRSTASASSPAASPGSSSASACSSAWAASWCARCSAACGGHVDAGRAVHHPDHRLPDARWSGCGIKHTGIPVPQFAYGQTLQKVAELEKKITADPKEAEVRKIFKAAPTRRTPR